MKVLFPRNIEKGLLTSLSFQIGPFSVTLVQLLILALGVAAALGLINYMTKQGFSRLISILMGVPFIAIAGVVAFFNMSELSLPAFIAKMVRNHFFDTLTKYQVNYEKFDATKIAIMKYKGEDKKDVIEYKANNILDSVSLDKINSHDLLGT